MHLERRDDNTASELSERKDYARDLPLGRPGSRSGRKVAAKGLSDDAPLPRVQWGTTVPLLVVLALAVYVLLPQIATLHDTAHVLRGLRWWALALALLARGVSFWGYGYTLHAVAKLSGTRMSSWQGTRLSLAASSVGLVAGGPVGYAAAKYHWARGMGMSRDGAILCGWLPAVLNSVALIALAIAGSIELIILHLVTTSQLVALAVVSVALISLVVAALWIMRRQDLLIRLISWLHAIWSRVRRRPVDQDAIDRTVTRVAEMGALLLRGAWRQPLLGALFSAALDVAALACLFVAARQPIAFGALIAGYGLPQLFGQATFVPGGIGIVEGGMVGLYIALGVPASSAVLVVLAYRGVSFWLPTLMGFPFAGWMQHAHGRRRRARALP